MTSQGVVNRLIPFRRVILTCWASSRRVSHDRGQEMLQEKTGTGIIISSVVTPNVWRAMEDHSWAPAWGSQGFRIRDSKKFQTLQVKSILRDDFKPMKPRRQVERRISQKYLLVSVCRLRRPKCSRLQRWMLKNNDLWPKKNRYNRCHPSLLEFCASLSLSARLPTTWRALVSARGTLCLTFGQTLQRLRSETTNSKSSIERQMKQSLAQPWTLTVTLREGQLLEAMEFRVCTGRVKLETTPETVVQRTEIIAESARQCARFWDPKKRQKISRNDALLMVPVTTTLFVNQTQLALTHAFKLIRSNRTLPTCYALIRISEEQMKQAASVCGTSTTKCPSTEKKLNPVVSFASLSPENATSNPRSPPYLAQPPASTALKPASSNSSSSKLRSRARSAEVNPTTTPSRRIFRTCRAPTPPKPTPMMKSKDRRKSEPRRSKSNNRLSWRTVCTAARCSKARTPKKRPKTSPTSTATSNGEPMPTKTRSLIQRKGAIRRCFIPLASSWSDLIFLHDNLYIQFEMLLGFWGFGEHLASSSNCTNQVGR